MPIYTRSNRNKETVFTHKITEDDGLYVLYSSFKVLDTDDPCNNHFTLTIDTLGRGIIECPQQQIGQYVSSFEEICEDIGKLLEFHKKEIKRWNLFHQAQKRINQGRYQANVEMQDLSSTSLSSENNEVDIETKHRYDNDNDQRLEMSLGVDGNHDESYLILYDYKIIGNTEVVLDFGKNLMFMAGYHEEALQEARTKYPNNDIFYDEFTY